tara:strand:+ start:468 stop:1739 length:1272 start_codon:yes stop_codon:yes gene_type:complete
MEQLNINEILDRKNEEQILINFLDNFNKNKDDILLTRGLYVYGHPGTGKTQFVTRLLKKMNYDVISYDAGDIRNKKAIEEITKNNMSATSVVSMFTKKVRKIVIVMDEIDGMNSGDKGGITSLIKLVRPKKTKKQKKEYVTMIPIICIGNYHMDKKIKEMMKVCSTLELKKPSNESMSELIKKLMPKISKKNNEIINEFTQKDLRKLSMIHNMYIENPSILNLPVFNDIFIKKNYNENSKDVIRKLFNNDYNLLDHNELMNETDRTSVALLFHENIIDVIGSKDINFYTNLLDNVCFADYIDRITFQKQIWSFNEMSSLIKTMFNHKLLSEYKKTHKLNKFNPKEVRFTKVLTKYSTEYNNGVFIQMLCRELNMDKKDMLSYFSFLKNKYSLEEMYELFNEDVYEIKKLDVNRIVNFIIKITL